MRRVSWLASTALMRVRLVRARLVRACLVRARLITARLITARLVRARLITARLIAAGVVLAGLLACGGPAPVAGRPTAIGPPPVASLTDVVWAQLTVAMNQRAIQVLDLVPGHAADPRLIAFANDLLADHGLEVERIGAELLRLGVGGGNPHAGHDMPGMATIATLGELEHATGERFDRIALDALRAHLSQCRTLAAGELASGSDPTMMELAKEVTASRRTELAALETIS